MSNAVGAIATRDNMSVRVAVVTGANKGIGLEIVRALCRHFGQDGVVYLTARNEGRGRAAVELLQKEGLDPKFHLLDVTDQASIDTIRNHLEKEHGGIDVLVNNAGIGTSKDNSSFYEKQFRVMEANFFGLLSVCRSLTPLVRSGGRIVNVASTTGYMVFREQLTEEIRNRFRQVKEEQDVVNLMNEFLECCKMETNAANGWSEWSYGVGKLGVILLSKMQAEKISLDASKQDILVNACCPGFVQTDMTAHLPDNQYGYNKVTTVEGADTPVFLALLPPGVKEPNGQFLLKRKIYDFINTDVSIQI
ncbi:carbonyl reductase [NADPH] 1-like [Strongylocentrotus purpuratus]|uniref:carbonyl reductase (NADPH) n=2 Tax=Strongylocentrotus purpuratus TaxID=7668 RepID=A0A7M7HNE4_STRPU|nr:carbonyl reductase [NADPH] 1-like [Strongylocentrotus purpuratus]